MSGPRSISADYRIAAYFSELRRRLLLGDEPADFPGLIRTAQALGLTVLDGNLGEPAAWWVVRPCLVRVKGRHPGLRRQDAHKLHRLVDLITRESAIGRLPISLLSQKPLVRRTPGGAGVEPASSACAGFCRSIRCLTE